MYIAQVQNTLHDWWRYIIGVIIAIVGVFVFSVPHLIGLGYKVAQGELEASQLEDVSAVMTAFSSNVNLIFIILPFLGGLLFLLFAVKKTTRAKHYLINNSKKNCRLETNILCILLLGYTIIWIGVIRLCCYT